MSSPSTVESGECQAAPVASRELPLPARTPREALEIRNAFAKPQSPAPWISLTDSIVNGLFPVRLEDASHAAIATSTPRLNDYDS
jgi:hypothetical protein